MFLVHLLSCRHLIKILTCFIRLGVVQTPKSTTPFSRDKQAGIDTVSRGICKCSSDDDATDSLACFGISMEPRITSFQVKGHALRFINPYKRSGFMQKLCSLWWSVNRERCVPSKHWPWRSTAGLRHCVQGVMAYSFKWILACSGKCPMGHWVSFDCVGTLLKPLKSYPSYAWTWKDRSWENRLRRFHRLSFLVNKTMFRPFSGLANRSDAMALVGKPQWTSA